MTEDEAKNKWCPFVRKTLVDDKLISNRFIGDDAHEGQPIHSFCIGSQCMAWRAKLLPGETVPTPDDWVGYCGLAGKP